MRIHTNKLRHMPNTLRYPHIKYTPILLPKILSYTNIIQHIVISQYYHTHIIIHILSYTYILHTKESVLYAKQDICQTRYVHNKIRAHICHVGALYGKQDICPARYIPIYAEQNICQTRRLLACKCNLRRHLPRSSPGPRALLSLCFCNPALTRWVCSHQIT
jgi:hypothetical protein